MSTTRKLFLFVGLPLVAVFLAVFFYVSRSNSSTTSEPTTNSTASSQTSSSSCDKLVTPVDISLVTSILYPGQTRGGNYKAHGGFRIDNATTNSVDVKAPLDAQIVDGSRYLEQGEVQYMFDFKTNCGLSYRLDHLRTLSDKLQKLADTLPAAQNDDSRTTNFATKTSVTASEVVATAVGFAKGSNGPNVAFDFGLYDNRQKNEASKDSTWAALHKDNQLASYAVCWLDWLPAADATIAKALPAGDGQSGKTSDYCKN